jgi:hypothetical protein
MALHMTLTFTNHQKNVNCVTLNILTSTQSKTIDKDGFHDPNLQTGHLGTVAFVGLTVGQTTTVVR